MIMAFSAIPLNKFSHRQWNFGGRDARDAQSECDDDELQYLHPRSALALLLLWKNDPLNAEL